MGNILFDELFVLGFDRDTDLWMRGHPGLISGEKGRAPMGRNYALENMETSKPIRVVAPNDHTGRFPQIFEGNFILREPFFGLDAH